MRNFGTCGRHYKVASGKFRNCVAIINCVAENNSTVGYASMRTAQLS